MTYQCWTTLVLISACGSSVPEVEYASIGELELSIPARWHGRDTSRPDAAVMIWTPDENVSRESVSVIRTRRLPEMSGIGPLAIGRILNDAIRTLPRETFAPSITLRTKFGFLGASVDGLFVPPGSDHPYHRIHAVLLDGDSLVHVIFTTASTGANAEAYYIVLESLRRKVG
jgi:hypothetical protein